MQWSNLLGYTRLLLLPLVKEECRFTPVVKGVPPMAGEHPHWVLYAPCTPRSTPGHW